MLSIIIIQFLFFSFIGWIIDSGYRSIVDKKLINAGYFKGPFCPIYGFGGLILLYSLKLMNDFPIYMILLTSSILMILVELFGGIFSEKVLKVKLWDYSNTTLNIGGHIDVLHSFYWVILVSLVYFFVFPFNFIFEQLITPPEILEIPIFIIFSVITLWLTIRKIPFNYLNIKGSMLNMSVTEYQYLFTNIKKLMKSAGNNKKVILTKIEKVLDKSKATLKYNFNK